MIRIGSLFFSISKFWLVNATPKKHVYQNLRAYVWSDIQGNLKKIQHYSHLKMIQTQNLTALNP